MGSRATVTRNADGSLNFTPFSLAAGSDLVNGGITPPGMLPFDGANDCVGMPELGVVEAR